ncbi:hypothetical protein DOO74_07700, partial [Rhodobacteraceae bacterium AsT-22]
MTTDFRDIENTENTRADGNHDDNYQKQSSPMVSSEAERRAHIIKWIAKRQKTAAATFGSAMAVLPAMASAQAGAGELVNAADIAGVRSAEVLDDGSARLVLDDGRILRITSQDFVAGASGEVLVGGQALDLVTEAAAAAVGGGAGGGINAGALAAG